MPTVRKDSPKEEIWKSPPSLNKWWVEVSNLGRARTLTHKVKFVCRGTTVERESVGMIRRTTIDSRGRLQLQLKDTDCGKPHGWLLHRLVAECFVENTDPSKYNYVFFKNGDISDCRAENLQWGDDRDRAWLMKGKHAKHIVKIYSNGILCGEYFGLGEAADALGCTKQAIHGSITRGHLCKGFEVKYEEKGNKVKPSNNIEEGRKRNEELLERDDEFPESLFG